MMNRENIDDLILGYCDGTLSEEEKGVLNAWIESSVDNDRYFSDFVRVHFRLVAAGKWKDCNRRKFVFLVERKRSLKQVWYGIAAACVVVGVLCSLLLARMTDGERGGGVSLAGITKVDSGMVTAYLRLESGDRFELNKGESEYLKVKQSLEIEDSLSIPLTRHTIVVPPRGEYSMVLDDGTKVWLNSASELEISSSFEGRERHVYLKGEAYFEVAADSSKPFYVNLAEGVVKVVGTSFNISSYAEDNRVQVALANGKVSFQSAKQEYALLPGQIATLDKVKREVSVREGDVKAIIGWHEGNFIFEDVPLQELVMKLERWYQVEFLFLDKESREMRFSGAVEKHRTLDYVLNIISQMAPVYFEADGEHTIRVYRRARGREVDSRAVIQ